jgi:hypothetical protein
MNSYFSKTISKTPFKVARGRNMQDGIETPNRKWEN